MSSLCGYGVKLSKIDSYPGALEFSFMKHFCISFCTIYADYSREDQLCGHSEKVKTSRMSDLRFEEKAAEVC
jgi:hypothetical protein